MLLRGIILTLTLLGADSPEEAIMDTWNAIQNGSPAAFLATLSPDCSSNITQVCDDYLEEMRTLSPAELGELFASFRIEAAPNEIEFWNSNAVLEMLLSSPSQRQKLENTTITVDSMHEGDSTSKVCITVTIQNSTTALELPAVSSPLGWHTAGLETIVETLLNTAISN